MYDIKELPIRSLVPGSTFVSAEAAVVYTISFSRGSLGT